VKAKIANENLEKKNQEVKTHSPLPPFPTPFPIFSLYFPLPFSCSPPSLSLLRLKLITFIYFYLFQSHLSDQDFVTVFKVTKEEFAKMPGWKQDSKKKEVGLF
jgi:hypothetical protein